MCYLIDVANRTNVILHYIKNKTVSKKSLTFSLFHTGSCSGIYYIYVAVISYYALINSE